MARLDTTGREAAIARALSAATARPEPERVMLPWKTGSYMATVVELGVHDVVLNPASHRIRAQLESAPRFEVVDRDPFGPEAQAIIESLLREAKEFEGLKDNLAEFGQVEPGVVTINGLLINANTRCVALRDNGARYIRVAVLPADAAEEEVDRLELRLQMKRDFHSDYTFTNELLFIEDLIRKYRYDPQDIAVEMGWATRSDKGALRRQAARVGKHIRMLALIREVQQRCGGRIPLTDFDSNRQSILELDDDYEALKENDLPGARELRVGRLAAMLVDAGYRDLREIDARFVETYLVPAMEDRAALRPFIDALTRRPDAGLGEDLPGLDLLAEFQPQTAVPARSAEPILDLLADSFGNETIVLKSGAREETVGRELFKDLIRTSIAGAAEDSRLDREEGDLLVRPLDLVRKATKQSRAALDALGQVEGHLEFDIDRMRQAIGELGEVYGALVRATSDGSSNE